MHDPALGRFMGIDLMSEDYSFQSPYTYAANNPIRFIDYLGMSPNGDLARATHGNYYGSMYDDSELQNGDPPTTTIGGSESVLLDDVTVTGKQWGTLPGDVDPTPSDATASNPAHWNNMTMMGALQYNAVRGHKQSIDILNSIQPGLAYSVILNNMRAESGEAFFTFGFLVTTAPLSFFTGGAQYTSYLTSPLFRGSALSTATAVADGSFYSVAFEYTLAKNLFPGVNSSRHITAANRAMLATFDEAMLSELNIVMKTRSNGGIVMNSSPHNWVWHHDIGQGVMQLVPKTQHTPGSIFWNTLHPGGRGGMSIWGGGY